MTLDDLVNSTCLLGLSYFDTDKSLMKQTQIAGVVAHIDKENGISIRLKAEASTSAIASDAEGKIFVVPPVLETWFKAPNGIYRDADGNIAIENPDYFVTWDIYKTQDDTEEGQHEWWDWVPRVAPPSVSASPDK